MATPNPNQSTPRASLRAGIDLGGTKIQAIIVDANHQVIGQARSRTPTNDGATGVINGLASTLQAAAAAAGCEPSALAGVGIGSPGAVDVQAGTVTGARNLAGFDATVAMAGLLSDTIGVPCFLGNDVGVALDAEAKLGAGRSTHSFLGVWWGTGIGGGFVIDGKRWLGRGAAGEIGHVVVKMGGARCSCGRRGCLEAYAGRRTMELRAQRLVDRGANTRLFTWAKKDGQDHLTSSVWAKALVKEDRVATHLIDRAVRALGAGLASAVNLLDVEAVVIGGGLGTRFGEPMAERIAAAMQPHLLLDTRPPRIGVSQLGDLGGAIGASLLVPR